MYLQYLLYLLYLQYIPSVPSIPPVHLFDFSTFILPSVPSVSCFTLQSTLSRFHVPSFLSMYGLLAAGSWALGTTSPRESRHRRKLFTSASPRYCRWLADRTTPPFLRVSQPYPTLPYPTLPDMETRKQVHFSLLFFLSSLHL